jgi:hypothetical protein
MNLQQFAARARRYLDARITIQLISAPGLGKSETIEGLIEKLSAEDGKKWGLGTHLAASFTPPDVLGYLVPTKREMLDGSLVDTSDFTMPPWLLSNEGRPMNEYERGIVFFDEWDKVEPDTKRALAQVLLRGQVGRWGLHPGIGVMTAANRPEDRSGSTKEYDFIINRRAEVHIIPDVNSWEDWAVRREIDPLGIAFAKRNVDVVFSGKVPDKQGPYCTPRSFVMMLNLLKPYLSGSGMPLDDKQEMSLITEDCSGLVGAPAANQFLTWCSMRTEVPDFETIIKDPANVEIPKKPDGKMLVAYDCAHRCTPENADKVITYALRLPKEFQITFGAAAVKRNFRLLATKAFMQRFTPENAGLVGLVSQ